MSTKDNSFMLTLGASSEKLASSLKDLSTEELETLIKQLEELPPLEAIVDDEPEFLSEEDWNDDEEEEDLDLPLEEKKAAVESWAVKMAETEKERAKRYGRTGAKVMGGVNAARLAAGLATDSDARAFFKAHPVASLVGSGAITGGAIAAGYGAGRLVHRIKHGPATDKKVKSAGIKDFVRSKIDKELRESAKRVIKQEIADRAPHAKKALKNIGIGAGTGAVSGAITGGVSASASNNDPNESKLTKVLKRTTRGALLGGAVGGAAGGILSKADIGKAVNGKSKTAGPFSSAVGTMMAKAAPMLRKAQPMAGQAMGAAIRTPLATRAAVGAGVGAAGGAANYAMSNDPNKSLLGSMAAGATLGAGAGAASRQVALRAAMSKGQVGNMARDAMAAGGQGKILRQMRVGKTMAAPKGQGPVPRENYVKKHEQAFNAQKAAPTKPPKPQPDIEETTVIKKRTPGSASAPTPDKTNVSNKVPGAPQPLFNSAPGVAKKHVPGVTQPIPQIKPKIQMPQA